MLVLGHPYDNLLRLGVGVLGSDDLGVGGGSEQLFAFTATPQSLPWSCLGLLAMISGTAGQCGSVPLPQWLLGLVPGPAR